MRIRMKLFAFLLLFTILSSSVYIFAVENGKAFNTARLNKLSIEYNLKDISLEEVPDGVTPIVVNSLDELEMVVKNIKGSTVLDD